MGVCTLNGYIGNVLRNMRKADLLRQRPPKSSYIYTGPSCGTLLKNILRTKQNKVLFSPGTNLELKFGEGV